MGSASSGRWASTPPRARPRPARSRASARGRVRPLSRRSRPARGRGRGGDHEGARLPARRHRAGADRARVGRRRRRGAARGRRRRRRQAVPHLGAWRTRSRASPPDRAARRPTPGVAVIGDHPAMRQVLDRVDQIADTDASVLIRGETGTGKEVIARLIHGASGRRDRPVRRGQHGRHPRVARRGRAVRPRARRLHRTPTGRAPGAWSPRTAGRCSSTRSARCRAACRRSSCAPCRTREVTPVGGGRRCPSTCASSPPPTAISTAMIGDGRLPRGSLLPPRRRADRDPAAARAPRGHPGAGRALPPRGERARGALASPASRWTSCSASRTTTGRATCASSRTSSSALVVIAGTRMVVMKDLPAHMRTQVLDLERAARDLPVERRRPARAAHRDRGAPDRRGARTRTGGNRNRAAELLGLNRTTLVEKLRRRNVA